MLHASKNMSSELRMLWKTGCRGRAPWDLQAPMDIADGFSRASLTLMVLERRRGRRGGSGDAFSSCGPDDNMSELRSDTTTVFIMRSDAN